MLNMSSVTDVFLGISQKYSEQLFWKKRFWWMFHILECFWCGNTQKYFDGSKPSSKLSLKTKWYRSCGSWDDSRSCEQLKNYVTDKYFEKKVRFWTLITFRYMKCMLPLQYLNDWCLLPGVYVWQKFWRKNISNWVIIWIKFKFLWLL